MKISVDDVELYTLSKTKKKVIEYQISSDIFYDDMKRRLEWVLMHKYNQVYKRLKDEWEPKLAASGIKSIPTDPDEFAELVFAQPNYKDRKMRDKESIL
jgi:hypothetical protein